MKSFGMWRNIVMLLMFVAAVAVFTGCANRGAATSAEATSENPMQLSLAHNINEGHITHKALKRFADNVAEKSGGRILIRIYSNGVLGSETEVLEQLMAGVVDMTRVSAPGLATYNEGYHAFGLPYIFDDADTYYRVMRSDLMGDFFRSTGPDGFITLTYYTSGIRSFYTIDRPIRKPEDLKGLKIRVQDMRSQTDMMRELGGTPVAMAMGDVYTALTTGIIDGSENNETVLTAGMHGEVCKFYSVDQHTMIPDALVMSTPTWNRLNEADRQLIIDCAKESTEWHVIQWETAVADALKQATSEMGVTIVEDVDKAAFRSATANMIGNYRAQYPIAGKVLDIIERAK